MSLMRISQLLTRILLTNYFVLFFLRSWGFCEWETHSFDSHCPHPMRTLSDNCFLITCLLITRSGKPPLGLISPLRAVLWSPELLQLSLSTSSFFSFFSWVVLNSYCQTMLHALILALSFFLTQAPDTHGQGNVMVNWCQTDLV